ncbi:MAG: hypothetical protein HY823_00445 [Acidobacteria bacterium]|nr:hypothetical protein [Acidobacteriota bacterium]
MSDSSTAPHPPRQGSGAGTGREASGPARRSEGSCRGPVPGAGILGISLATALAALFLGPAPAWAQAGSNIATLQKQADAIKDLAEVLEDIGDRTAARRILSTYKNRRLSFGPIDGGDNAMTDPDTKQITLNPNIVFQLGTARERLERTQRIRVQGSPEQLRQLRTSEIRKIDNGHTVGTAEAEYISTFANIASTIEHENVHAGQDKSLFNSWYQGESQTTTRAKTRESPAWAAGLNAIARWIRLVDYRLRTARTPQERSKWHLYRLGLLKSWMVNSAEIPAKVAGGWWSGSLHGNQTFTDPIDGSVRTFAEISATIGRVNREILDLEKVDPYQLGLGAKTVNRDPGTGEDAWTKSYKKLMRDSWRKDNNSGLGWKTGKID